MPWENNDVFYFFHRLRGGQVMSAPPLVVRCGAFGDVVMVTPMIRLLAARYQGKVDVIGSGGWTAPLLQHEPALGHLQMLSSRTTPYWLCPSQWQLVRWLRQRGRGPVYLCDTDPKIGALLQRAGLLEDDIVRRLPSDDEVNGITCLWPDRWISMGQRDPARDYGARHDIQAHTFRLPQLVVTDAARAEFVQWRAESGLKGPLVLFQPGNKRTHKRGGLATRQHPKFWPPEHWAAVAQAVWKKLPEAQIVLCGSPLEHPVLEEIRTAAGHDPRMHNGAHELPIPRLLAMIEQSHSLVSVDTGPAHAAAALGCPLVVLYGAASPKKWRPLGPATILTLGGEKGEQSRVSDIPVEDV
ncbi:MAG: glycosyltransferase family 9 protein, partial [Pseudoxanthomonas sp.]